MLCELHPKNKIKYKRMKHITLTLVLFIMVSVFPAKSQIQFEHSYNHSATTTQLEVDGQKIFLMNVLGEQCEIYNMDYSHWKTIKFNIPNDRYLTDVKFVSQHVFNSDDLLEVLIIYYQYVEVGNSYYYIYTSQVINENGTVLISEPGGAYADLKKMEDSGSKLFLYIYDYSSFPYSVETKVYGVPGILLGKPEIDISDVNSPNESFTFYPNPTSGEVSIRTDQSVFSRDAWLIIRDESGSLKSRTMLKQGSTEDNLNLLELPSGIYFYEVITPHYRSKPASFVKL